jgi:hypothetical protein
MLAATPLRAACGSITPMPPRQHAWRPGAELALVLRLHDVAELEAQAVMQWQRACGAGSTAVW